jgi:hypothetical protein
MGWMIVDEKSDPPVIPWTYERDEAEQVRHLPGLGAKTRSSARSPPPALAPGQTALSHGRLRVGRRSRAAGR